MLLLMARNAFIATVRVPVPTIQTAFAHWVLAVFIMGIGLMEPALGADVPTDARMVSVLLIKLVHVPR